MSNIELGTRIKELRRSRKLKQGDLAKLANLTQQAISSIETGKTSSPLSIVAIANVLKVSPTWLKTGKGNKEALVSLSNKGESIVLAPLLNWSNAKDWRNLIGNTTMKSEKTIPCIQLEDENFFALQIPNDVMTSLTQSKLSFNKDEIIIVSPDKLPKSGDCVVAIVDGATIFRQYIQDGNKLYLKPLNSQYPTHELQKHDQIIGTLCQSIKIY